VRIARRIRRETKTTLGWIESRLGMGVWTYVSNLSGQRRNHPPERRGASDRVNSEDCPLNGTRRNPARTNSSSSDAIWIVKG